MAKLQFKLALIIFLAAAFTLSAQTKDSVKQKLKNLKGHAEKIIIQTDEGELTLEGKEADYLLRKMKRDSRASSFSIFTPDDDFFADGNVFKFKGEGLRIPHLPKIKMFRHHDDDFEMLDGFNQKITVEKEDGKIKVTIKKKVDGEEVTETYEGEEAEKFLEELNEDEPFELNFKMKDEENDKDRTIIIIK